MTSRFNANHGVFCCVHVLAGGRAVQVVVRDAEGRWRFLCGGADEQEIATARLVSVGQLLDRDPTLETLISLRPGWVARRGSQIDDWEYSDL